MAKEEHSHWSKYHSRVVRILFGSSAFDDTEEYLQLICELDGVIFHEVEVKREA